uniref:Hypotheticial protein n=1 Tax=Schistosoma japonicum TaxID=6182 RepID=C7TZF3_SCHJA|nr:hypotheticial protein [Schistosoma japonicum]
MKLFCVSCLTFLSVMQLLVEIPNCVGWSITCNETMCCENDTDGNLCCEGNFCKYPIYSPEKLVTIYQRKGGMVNRLKMALQKLSS